MHPWPWSLGGSNACLPGSKYNLGLTYAHTKKQNQITGIEWIRELLFCAWYGICDICNRINLGLHWLQRPRQRSALFILSCLNHILSIPIMPIPQVYHQPPDTVNKGSLQQLNVRIMNQPIRWESCVLVSWGTVPWFMNVINKLKAFHIIFSSSLSNRFCLKQILFLS